MDKLEPLEFDRQPLEMKLKKRSSKRTMKKRKLVSGITKKDRMDLKKWEKKIIALNKKINEQIKNKKSCKKQPLAVTFEKAKRMKLSRKKRGARKPKETAATGAVAAAATDAVADAAEETPVQEETPTPTDNAPTENTPVENSTPEESKEEKSESEESPASAPEPKEETPKEETPKEEESGSVLSSVTEGVKSAAESVGLTSKPEEEKTVGGRAKKGKGKKGKKGKWV